MEQVGQNPGNSAYGFCLRDIEENLWDAESHSLGSTTNMEAEAKAIWYAIGYCIDKGLTNVQIQIDSLMLKQMVSMKWKLPWDLIEIIEAIQRKTQTI